VDDIAYVRALFAAMPAQRARIPDLFRHQTTVNVALAAVPEHAAVVERLARARLAVRDAEDRVRRLGLAATLPVLLSRAEALLISDPLHEFDLAVSEYADAVVAAELIAGVAVEQQRPTSSSKGKQRADTATVAYIEEQREPLLPPEWRPPPVPRPETEAQLEEWRRRHVVPPQQAPVLLGEAAEAEPSAAPPAVPSTPQNDPAEQARRLSTALTRHRNQVAAFGTQVEQAMTALERQVQRYSAADPTYVYLSNMGESIDQHLGRLRTDLASYQIGIFRLTNDLRDARGTIGAQGSSGSTVYDAAEDILAELNRLESRLRAETRQLLLPPDRRARQRGTGQTRGITIGGPGRRCRDLP